MVCVQFHGVKELDGDEPTVLHERLVKEFTELRKQNEDDDVLDEAPTKYLPYWMQVGKMVHIIKRNCEGRVVSVPTLREQRENPAWTLGVELRVGDGRDPINTDGYRAEDVKQCYINQLSEISEIRNNQVRRTRQQNAKAALERGDSPVHVRGFKIGDHVLLKGQPTVVTGLSGGKTIVVTSYGTQMDVDENELDECTESPHFQCPLRGQWCREGAKVFYTGSGPNGPATVTHVQEEEPRDDGYIQYTIYIQMEDGSDQLRKTDIKNINPIVNPIITSREVERRIPHPPKHISGTRADIPLEDVQPGAKVFSLRHRRRTSVLEVHIDPDTGGKYALLGGHAISKEWPSAMMTAWTAELCGLRDPQAEEMELVQRVKQAKEEGRDEDNRPCVGLEATVGTVVQFQTTSDWMMQTNQPTEWKTGIITQMTTDRFSEGGEVRVTVQYDTGAETDDSTEVHAEQLRHTCHPPLHLQVPRLPTSTIKVSILAANDEVTQLPRQELASIFSSETRYSAKVITLHLQATAAKPHRRKRAVARICPPELVAKREAEQRKLNEQRWATEQADETERAPLDQQYWANDGDVMEEEIVVTSRMAGVVEEDEESLLEQEQLVEHEEHTRLSQIEEDARMARRMEQEQEAQTQLQIDREVQRRMEVIEEQKETEEWLQVGREVYSLVDTRMVLVKSVTRENQEPMHECFVLVNPEDHRVAYRHSSTLRKEAPAGEDEEALYVTQRKRNSEDDEGEDTLRRFCEKKRREQQSQQSSIGGHSFTTRPGEGNQPQDRHQNNSTQEWSEVRHEDIQQRFRELAMPSTDNTEDKPNRVLMVSADTDISGTERSGTWGRQGRKSPSDLASTSSKEALMAVAMVYDTDKSCFRLDDSPMWVPSATEHQAVEYDPHSSESAKFTINTDRKFDPMVTDASWFRGNFYEHAAFKLRKGTPMQMIVEQILRNVNDSTYKTIIGEGAEDWVPERVFNWLEMETIKHQAEVETPNERVRNLLTYKANQADGFEGYSRKVTNLALDRVDLPVKPRSLNEAQRMFEETAAPEKFLMLIRIIQHVVFTRLPNHLRLLAVMMSSTFQRPANDLEGMKTTFAEVQAMAKFIAPNKPTKQFIQPEAEEKATEKETKPTTSKKEKAAKAKAARQLTIDASTDKDLGPTDGKGRPLMFQKQDGTPKDGLSYHDKIKSGFAPSAFGLKECNRCADHLEHGIYAADKCKHQSTDHFPSQCGSCEASGGSCHPKTANPGKWLDTLTCELCKRLDATKSWYKGHEEGSYSCPNNKEPSRPRKVAAVKNT